MVSAIVVVAALVAEVCYGLMVIVELKDHKVIDQMGSKQSNTVNICMGLINQDGESVKSLC